MPEQPDSAPEPVELPILREFDDRSSLWLFEDPRNLHDLIRLLDPGLAGRLDFTHAQRQNRSFIDPDLREKESDLLYSVPFRDDAAEGEAAEEVWVYVLVENKSQPQRRAVLTLLGYMLQIWEREADEWESRQRPPEQQWLHPIIPLVYYTGERSWRAPTDLASLFRLPRALAREFVPNFAPLFLSLRDCSPEQLTGQATAIGYALRVWQAEAAPTAEFAAVLREALAGLEGLAKEQEALWTRVVWFLLLFVYHRRGEEDLRGALIERVRQSHFSEKERVATMGLSIAEKLEARALRSSLEAFLTARFGPLPEAMRQAIAAASAETVSGWIPRAATAATLAEVGIPGSTPPG